MIAVSSIKSKILIFAVLATLIPSAGLGLLSFWQNETMIADNVTHQLRVLAGDTRRELEFWLKERVDGLRTLSNSNTVINGIAQHNDTADGDNALQMLPHYLRLVEQKLDALLQLTVLDASGKQVASSAQTGAVVSLSAPWPEDAATKGVVIDAPHWDSSAHTATFSLAVPVLSLDDKIIGALVAVVDLNSVAPTLKHRSDISAGYVVLMDRAGRPLLDTLARSSELSPLESRTVQRLIQHQGQPIVYERPLTGEVLGLADTAGTLPLLVVAERDRDEIYQAWTAFRNLFLSLLGGLTLLVALIGWGMGRSIVTPLERLTGAADRVAAGDLEIALPVTRRDEIGRLTRVFNQMTEHLRHSHAQVEAANQALQQQNQLLERLSITDNLTGLYNRKKLDDILTDQLARYERHRHPFAVLLLDIDHFKALNDSYGHLAGDEVLKSVAHILTQSIRSVDYAARYGGEEFVIVLPETNTATARDLAERICGAIRDKCCQFEGQSLAVTLSIGVAGIRDSDKNIEAIIARADEVLYAAKHAGRNRVHCAL